MNDLLYPISVVAELLNIHPQTLRKYEVKGLIVPKRKGRARMYSDSDVDDIRAIMTLTRDMGVNLAGVEIVLKMRRREKKLRREMKKFVSIMKELINKEKHEKGKKGAIVKYMDYGFDLLDEDKDLI